MLEDVNKSIELIELIQKHRRKIGFFIICLTASLFIWLSIKLSDRYYLRQDCTILLTNVPLDKLLTSENQKAVSVRFEGTGWSLLRLRLKHFNSLVLDLPRMAGTKISLNKYREQFTKQLPDGITITDVEPDILDISYLELITKKVPIELDINDIHFKSQYWFPNNPSDIRLIPDSVTIRGSKQQLEHINEWKIPSLKIKNLNDTLVRTLNLNIAKDEQIFVEPLTSTLTIPVEIFTEGRIEIPVKCLHKDDWNMQLLPPKVVVTYLCSLSNFQQVEADMFSVYADLNEWTGFGSTKLTIHLERAPDFVRIVHIQPQQLDFFLRK